jgi:hypothetical protein
MKAHYPGRGITKDLKTTFVDIHEAWLERTKETLPWEQNNE